jgi:hypothetical protein
MNSNGKLYLWVMSLIKEAWLASLPLIKITIPVVIVVRIFYLIGLDAHVNAALRPIMLFVGLPPEAGIVWASALVGNLYSAFMVFLSHAVDLGLTTAQVTVLLTMVLVAHSFPIELRATQMVGINSIYMGTLRFTGAIALGWVMSKIYYGMNIAQELAVNPGISSSSGKIGWVEWGLGELRNLSLIYGIVFSLIVLMKILKAISFDKLIEYALWPLNVLLQTNRKTSSFNVIGMIAGISYGSALMLQELKQNNFSNRDILVTMTFMGLAHGLIEETLLMVALKADWVGLLFGRLALACVAAMLIGILVRNIPKLINMPYFLNKKLLNTSEGVR